MEPAHAHPRPKAVILIRHAEKPEKKHKWWLNKKGQRRALYLAWYLRKRGPLATLLNRMGLRDASEPIAEAIFAMRQTQRKDGSFRSDRSRQTVQPYARRLMKTGRLANEDFHRWEHKGFRHEFAFEKGREEEMVDYINQYYWGCRVLIAWQHKNIKKILRAWGYKGSFKWKKTSYNRTVILAFMNGVPVITEHKQEKKVKKHHIRDIERFLTKHD